ncbi:MAG: thiol peroxidase [Bifidobacteriaceae bacterium]|jgi:thiol peroxidase|nr:thiol peroxidase [Bifidobacteriaceae bacterium]
MASIELNGLRVDTVGELPQTGADLPAFILTGNDLADVTSASFEGVKLVLNVFPSIDTGICATSVRRFNQLAASLAGAKVLCVSNDLPFALGRFCGAEGIDNVVTASAFRSTFGEDFGLTMTTGPLRGLLARAVVVADAAGRVVHAELVPVIGQEPDYAAAEAAVLAAP